MADTQEALETVRTFVEGAPPGEVCLQLQGYPNLIDGRSHWPSC